MPPSSRVCLGAAQLEGADLVEAQLQGANLGYAELQGANLARAQLQGADLDEAQLPGADLGGAQLEGADLSEAQLQGAHLRAAQLQGADLRAAQLQGADLGYAELPGADLDGADLDHSVLAKVLIWRARNATCTNARIASPLTNVIENRDGEAISATPDAIAEFIDRSVAEIPDADDKAKVANEMRERLVIDLAKDDTETIAKVWSTCERAETSTMPQEKFDEQRAAVLRDSAVMSPRTARPLRRASFATGSTIIPRYLPLDLSTVISRYFPFNLPVGCLVRMVRSVRRRRTLTTQP